MTKAGLGATGHALTGLAVIIGGKNTFGKTGDVKPLEVEYEVVNEESTGLIKSPMVTITVYDLSKHYLSAISRGEDIILKGNVRDEGKDLPVSIALSGQMHKMSPEFKEGEQTGRTFEIRADNYIEKINNEETIKWNRDKLDLVIGGDSVNLLEDFGKNIFGAQ